MGSKIVFFFAPKRYFNQGKPSKKKTYVIQLVKGYQNHPHMTLHDLPFVKKWGGQKIHFFRFWVF
jgi:hypothetical protein